MVIDRWHIGIGKRVCIMKDILLSKLYSEGLELQKKVIGAFFS